MTRPSDHRPTRRVLLGADGELVVELYRMRITIRPLGTRRGGPAEIEVTPSLVYQRELVARAERTRREKLARRNGQRRR